MAYDQMATLQYIEALLFVLVQWKHLGYHTWWDEGLNRSWTNATKQNNSEYNNNTNEQNNVDLHGSIKLPMSTGLEKFEFF